MGVGKESLQFCPRTMLIIWHSFMYVGSSKPHARYHLNHYTGDFLLEGPDEQEMVSMLKVLVSHMHARGKKINFIKVQEMATSINF